ncbi:unnamed protein product [Arctia plantaginis]|uniref:Uncharacterized protein n=1 Tax=Arctia plantaginis TaxID=874455 RepID=A0A8S1BI24_ARCPL|nr:unnamed protein product [Arctia plantaginis]
MEATANHGECCVHHVTSSERLEQPYHCDGCRSAQPATKKLQIWRLPPIMVSVVYTTSRRASGWSSPTTATGAAPRSPPPRSCRYGGYRPSW